MRRVRLWKKTVLEKSCRTSLVNWEEEFMTYNSCLYPYWALGVDNVDWIYNVYYNYFATCTGIWCHKLMISNPTSRCMLPLAHNYSSSWLKFLTRIYGSPMLLNGNKMPHVGYRTRITFQYVGWHFPFTFSICYKCAGGKCHKMSLDIRSCNVSIAWRELFYGMLL